MAPEKNRKQQVCCENYTEGNATPRIYSGHIYISQRWPTFAFSKLFPKSLYGLFAGDLITLRRWEKKPNIPA
jgi:hypothetical protein